MDVLSLLEGCVWRLLDLLDLQSQLHWRSMSGAVTIRVVRGQPFDRTLTVEQYAAIRFQMPARDGVVTRATGRAASRALPAVHDAQLTVAFAYVTLHHDSRDRRGYVIATDTTFAEAGQRADAERAALDVVVEPTAEPAGRSRPAGWTWIARHSHRLISALRRAWQTLTSWRR